MRKNNAVGNKVYFFTILFIQRFLVLHTCVFLFKMRERFPVGPNYEKNWHKNVKISKDVSLQEQLFYLCFP